MRPPIVRFVGSVAGLRAVLALAACGGGHDTDATTVASGTSGATSSDPTDTSGSTVTTAESGDTLTTLGDSGTGSGGGDNGAELFATSVLHRIDIVVEEQDLPTLDSDITVRVPCTITYDGETVTNAGIRRKGQSTLQPLDQKPSFSIKLDEEVPGQDLDGIEKFVLNNTIKDPTFTSEPLSYLVYQRAGVPAPRTAHAAVTFNGESKGFYVVVESVNKQFLEDHYGDGSGNLYEGPWDFSQDPAAAELKDLEDGRTRDDLVALTDAVNGATADSLERAIAPLADVDQLLRVFALDMAFCLWDGYAVAAWNFYLYHVPDTVPDGGRFVMLPHGADWPYWIADLDPMDPDFRPWGAEYPAGLLAIALTSPPFVQRYTDALRAVRDDAFDIGALGARVDEIDGVLHGADLSDPVLAAEIADFEAHVAEAHTFLTDRRAFLDGLPL
jgi:spore coat protein H